MQKKDIYAISIIGACFGLFAIPILKTADLSFVPTSVGFYAGLIAFFIIFANIALVISFFLSKSIPIVWQVAKFCAVGAFNTFLDWGVLNTLILVFAATSGVGYGLEKGVSFLISNVGSYFWNKYWTFNASSTKKIGREVASFIVVSVLGLCINIGVALILVNYVTPPAFFTPERWATVGAAGATVISLIWNFIGYKFVVFLPLGNKKDSFAGNIDGKNT